MQNRDTKHLKYIHAIKANELSSEQAHKSLQNASSLNKSQFRLCLGNFVEDQVTMISMFPLEQEKSKKEVYQLIFILKKQINVNVDDILLSYPINCTINANKMTVSEEEFRRMIQQFKRLDQNQSSDESSNSQLSDDILLGDQQISCPRRGRPKGSKNKKKCQNDESSSDQSYENSEDKRAGKRGRGRPKGAKNKKKIVFDNIENESNFHNLFKNLLQNRTLEEIIKKMNKTKKKQFRKQEEVDERSRHKTGKKGRPLGARNKKTSSRDSESQENIQLRHSRNKVRKYPKCCAKCLERQLKRQYLENKPINKANLTNLAENIGVQDTQNLIINAIKKNHSQALKELLQFVQKRENQFIVPWVCSIRLQKTIYTIRTRKQYVSKHQRQGNNALLQDCYHSHEKWWKAIGIERILQNMPKYQSGKEIYEILLTKEPQLQEIFYQNLPTLVRSGNDTLAYFLLNKLIDKAENASIYGYSRQHLECLNPERSQLYFKKSPMLKQNCTVNFCSPIHCAVINQNTDLLAYILKHISEFNVGDSLCRKPVHYAAVLQSTKPMEILLKHGADLKEMDKKKMTPLMLAAQFGRYNIIKLILEKTKDGNYINFKGEEGLSALHYATINKHHECIELLLNDPFVDKNSQTKEKFTILHLAAGNGSLDTVKTIIDKGVTLTNDCFRRSPLVIALRNHHNDIFFQLVQQNQTISKKDYSNNTLLHYAAAYGNIELVVYLNSVLASQRNKKNFYPWELAILKGHLECGKKLYDKNLSFDRHLLFFILKNPRGTSEYINIIKYLLDENLYQIDYQNIQAKNTCLHLVCGVSQSEYLKERRKQSSTILPNEFQEMQKALINLLIGHGANPQIRNQKQKRPVDLCIENENLIGIQLLLREIPFQNKIKNNHFIYYLTNLACRGKQQMKFVLEKLMQTDEKVLRVELKESQWNGFKFLIYLIKRFTETVHINFRNNYVKFMEIAERENRPYTSKQIILKTFQEYTQHEKNLMSLINFLVKNGAEPHKLVTEPKLQNQQENYRKWGIQHFLMRFPSLKLLRMFMKWIDTNFSTPNAEGRTPLHLLCMQNRQGSLFNSVNIDMHPVPYIDFILHEDYDGQKCLDYILNHGIYSIYSDINRSTPFLYAALNGQLNFMNSLKAYGNTINCCNLLNQVPLIEIIKTKHRFTLEQIQSILGHQEISLDVRDLNERNVLHHLVANAKDFDFSPQLCKKFINYGVNINSLDKFQRSPIFYCFIRIQYEEQHEKQEINNNDKIQILQTLLHYEDIDLNIVDIYNRTPLHYACQKNSFFSIMYSLDININYDIQDTEGNTPLAISLKHRNLNQAALLIKKGVKYGYVYDQGHRYSYFAYASKLSAAICFLLLDHGYPLQKALEEVRNEAFKRVLTKKYG